MRRRSINLISLILLAVILLPTVSGCIIAPRGGGGDDHHGDDHGGDHGGDHGPGGDSHDLDHH